MAEILKLNNVLPGVERPFRIEDLQHVYDALNITLGSNNKPLILSGFELIAADPQDPIGEVYGKGVLAFNGQLYYHSGENIIHPGDNVYAITRPSGDLRRFADGSMQDFSLKNVLVSDSYDVTGGVFVGEFVYWNVNEWRTNNIPEKSLSGGKLVKRSVGALQLADAAVATANIQNEAVTPPKMHRALAPVILNGVVEFDTLPGAIDVLDLLVYHSTTGYWEVRAINKNFYVGIKGVILRLNCSNINSSTLSSLPSVIPIHIVNNTDDDGPTNLRVAGSDHEGMPVGVVSPSIPPQRGSASITLVKTASGYMPVGAFSTYSP